MKKTWIAGGAALALGLGTLGVLPAQASSKGRKNTTIGLGAAAAYELLRGNTTTGLILGAGAAYGYKKYKDAKREEDRDYRYSDRYRDYRRHPARSHDEYGRGGRWDDGRYDR